MERFDIFGQYFQLNFNYNRVYQSKAGGFLTALFLLIILAYGSFQMTVLFQFTDLTISSYSTSIHPNDVYVANDSNMFLGFSIFDLNLKTLKYNQSKLWEYLSLKAVLMDEFNIPLRPLRLIDCRSSLFGFFLQDSVYPADVCVDFDNSKLYGNFFQLHNYSCISIRLSFDYDKYLKNPQEVNSLFPLYLSIYFPMVTLDLGNFSYPFTTHVGSTDLDLKIHQTKSSTMSYELLQIYTDTALVSTNEKVDNVYSSTFYLNEKAITDSRNFVEIDFFIEPKKTRYYRTYMKLIDAVVSCHSVINLSLLIIGFVARNYNTHMQKIEFLEKNVVYKSSENHSKDNWEKIFIQNSESQSKTSTTDVPKQVTALFDNRNTRQIKFDSKNILLSFIDQCRYVKPSERNIMRLMNNYFKHVTDVNYLILSVERFNYYLTNILSENQKELLFSSKMILDLDEIDNNLDRESLSNLNQDNLVRALKYYQSVIFEGKIDNTDLYLLNKY